MLETLDYTIRIGSIHRPFYISKYKNVDVLPIRIVKSNVSSVGPSSERNRNNRDDSTITTINDWDSSANEGFHSPT